MNVQDTIRRMLLLYPGITLNALDAYDHLFCVNGNGYEWKNGELVELFTEDPDKVPTLKEAVGRVLRYKLLENTVVCRLEAAVFALRSEDTEENLIEYNKKLYSSLNEDISLILRVSERMVDLEPHQKENYPEVRHFYGFGYYGLSNYSKLCCLPDDITSDWLSAAEWMFEFIKGHPELWHPQDEDWFPKIGKRIGELKRR